MELINHILERIETHPNTGSSGVLAAALASACNTRYGVSLLDASASLDARSKSLIDRLARITKEPDFSNVAQAHALERLKELGFLEHVAVSANYWKRQ